MKRIYRIFLFVFFSFSVGIFASPPKLSNVGNSCYMNSALQCFFNISSLTEYFSKTTQKGDSIMQQYISIVKDPNRSNLENFHKEIDAKLEQSSFLSWVDETLIERIIGAGASKEELYKPLLFKGLTEKLEFEQRKPQENQSEDVINSLKWAIKEYVSREKKFTELLNLPEELKKKFIKKVTSYQQQDASEFFTKFFDHMTNEVYVPRETKELIEKELKINLSSVLKRKSAEKISSESLDPQYILALEIPEKAKKLEECLEAFLKPEFLGKAKISDVEYLDVIKQMKIKKLPPYTVFSIKRFRFSYEELQATKDSRAITVPAILDMSEFVDGKVEDLIYELIGIVLHHGGYGGGHYTALIKDQREREPRWYHCDDTTITDPLNGYSAYRTRSRHYTINGYLFFFKKLERKKAEEFLKKREKEGLRQGLENLAAGLHYLTG